MSNSQDSVWTHSKHVGVRQKHSARRQLCGALDSGASGPGSSPCRGQSVVFLGKTL